MSKSKGTPRSGSKRTTGRADPVAFALRDRQFRQRIVKSKVKYDRKRCDNRSHPVLD